MKVQYGTGSRPSLICAMVTATALASSGTVEAQLLDTAINYQGQLKLDGFVVNDSADFLFTLFDTANEDRQITDPVLVKNVDVINGLFTAEINFGPEPWDTSPLWIEIAVRTPAWDGKGEQPRMTTLQPRQPLFAAPASLRTRGLHVNSDGHIGVGTTAADVRMRIDGGADASPTGGGYLVVGDSHDVNIAVDSNEIMARENGATATLLINREGGDVAIANAGDGNLGVGTAAPEARVHVKGGTDSEPIAGGFLILGSTLGTNLSMDNNEIMARNNGSTSTLLLNADGGDVLVGGMLDIGLEVVRSSNACDEGTTVTATCPAGKSVIGGGCSRICQVELYMSRPSGTTGWICGWDGCGTGFVCESEQIFAHAICARVK